MKKCSVLECNNNAQYSAHLSLAVHAGHPPIVSTALVYLCEEHKGTQESNWKDLNVDGNWDNICKSLESVGKSAPKKEFSAVILEPYEPNNNNSVS